MIEDKDFKAFLKICLDMYKKCDVYIEAHLKLEKFDETDTMLFWTGFAEIKREQFAELVHKNLSPEDQQKVDKLLHEFRDGVRELLKD